MQVTIKYDNASLEVILGMSQPQKHSYNLDSEINLTSLVVDISESETPITVWPENLESFGTAYSCKSENLLKVAEYIYEIIAAFNASFYEVYPEDVNGEATTPIASGA